MYNVIGTDTYLREIKKWPKTQRVITDKIPARLKSNPNIGKPLAYPFIREIRVREKRVYYLVYDELHLVLLVAVSGKKDQQDTINHIKENLAEFRLIAKDISKQVS